MTSSSRRNTECREKLLDGLSGRREINDVFPVASSHFSGGFPLFREPTEVGCFSLDGERHYHNDNSEKKYVNLKFTNLPFDLNQGYSQANRKDFLLCEKLDNILRWITLNPQNVLANFPPDSNRCFGADFVCYRGLLTSIVCSQYEYSEDWLICATKFKGTIYLYAVPTEERIEKEKTKTSRESRMSFWGYKFEQYMTTSTPNDPPNSREPVNENQEYCVVAKGRLNRHTFMFAAEVDGVDVSYSKRDISMKRYCELKTSRFITAGQRNLNFVSYKFMKWWAQSFLIGIPKVICGFRDNNGIVSKVDVIDTANLRTMGKNMWSPASMMIFCDKFLDFIQEHVIKDDPNVVYKFHYVAGQFITVEELPSPTEYQMLPSWYLSSWIYKTGN